MTFCIFCLFPRSEAAIVCTVTKKKKKDDAEKYLSGPLFRGLNNLLNLSLCVKWQPTPVFLPGESQERGSLVGCRLWGRTESDTTEAT